MDITDALLSAATKGMKAFTLCIENLDIHGLLIGNQNVPFCIGSQFGWMTQLKLLDTIRIKAYGKLFIKMERELRRRFRIGGHCSRPVTAEVIRERGSITYI